MTYEQRVERGRVDLINFVETKVPSFVEAVKKPVDVVILHQDAFAADYQDDEYALLGRCIKYAGYHGKDVTIMGTNRETIK